jgi:hypothetical protein
MNKLLLTALVLLQGCMMRPARINSSLNNPPAPSVQHLTDEDFNKIDANADGLLDKAELKRAEAINTISAPLQIFGVLIGAIALICLLPLAAPLTEKSLKFFKNRKASAQHQKK